MRLKKPRRIVRSCGKDQRWMEESMCCLSQEIPYLGRIINLASANRIGKPAYVRNFLAAVIHLPPGHPTRGDEQHRARVVRHMFHEICFGHTGTQGSGGQASGEGGSPPRVGGIRGSRGHGVVSQ